MSVAGTAAPVALAPDSRSRGLRQLFLTILAVVLGVGAYVLVTVGTTGKTPANVGVFVVVIAFAYLATHLVTRRLAPNADPAFLPTAGVLAGLGYAMVYRLRPDLARNQFVWLLIGLALYGLTLLVVRDHRRLQAYTYTIGLVGVGLLLLPIVPVIGHTVNGARLWVGIGPINFQPAEVGKVLLVIFLASYLSANKDLLAIAQRQIGPFQIPEPRHMAPILLAWVVSLAVLFLENDLGSSLLFFGLFVVLLWTATSRGTYLAAGILLFVVGAYLGYLIVPHVQVRVTAWLHALQPQYVHSTGYQLAQSEFAMASGGISGTGLGLGHPDRIPLVWTDFIFAAIGEELGLIGVTGLLLMYVVLVGRGLRAAISAEDAFGKLLVTGLVTALALQTFVIVGGVTRLIPLTGVTLPFVSYGGSSLVTNFVLLALLRLPAGAPEHGQASGA